MVIQSWWVYRLGVLLYKTIPIYLKRKISQTEKKKRSCFISCPDRIIVAVVITKMDPLNKSNEEVSDCITSRPIYIVPPPPLLVPRRCTRAAGWRSTLSRPHQLRKLYVPSPKSPQCSVSAWRWRGRKTWRRMRWSRMGKEEGMWVRRMLVKTKRMGSVHLICSLSPWRKPASLWWAGGAARTGAPVRGVMGQDAPWMTWWWWPNPARWCLVSKLGFSLLTSLHFTSLARVNNHQIIVLISQSGV